MNILGGSRTGKPTKSNKLQDLFTYLLSYLSCTIILPASCA